MSRLKIAASALAVAGLLFADLAAAQVQRTFVASYGNDANAATNCGFTNPCRGFTAAHAVTISGGEIVALDAAGYGAITITKSITITANPGFYAGISASSGNAVTIATGGVNVILRGLNINGIGAAHGVRMTSGSSLSIENCVISNFNNNGVYLTGTMDLRMSNSMVRGNNEGVWIEGGVTATIAGTTIRANIDSGLVVWFTGAAVTTTAAVSDSVISDNGNVGMVSNSIPATEVARTSITRSTIANNGAFGVYMCASGGTALASISYSLISGHTTAGLNNACGTIRSQGNNTLEQNSANTSGVITTFAGG